MKRLLVVLAAAVSSILAVAVVGSLHYWNDLGRSAGARAERAGVVMSRVRDGDAVDMVRTVLGGDPATDTAIEALVAEGDRFDGRIVLRITEWTERGKFDARPTKTVRCFEYRLGHAVDDHEPNRVTCPRRAPIETPPAPPQVMLPPDIDDDLRAALKEVSYVDLTEERLLEIVRPIAGTAPLVEVATSDATFGIAIGNGKDECVNASLRGSHVEVWRVPRVLAQPGELGCSAESAALGLGKTPPH